MQEYDFGKFGILSTFFKIFNTKGCFYIHCPFIQISILSYIGDLLKINRVCAINGDFAVVKRNRAVILRYTAPCFIGR